jgi:hypothetical protein
MKLELKEIIKALNNESIDIFSVTYEEGKRLDFKEISPIHTTNKSDINRAYNEFIKDLTSFANTEGGFIIYGVREEKRIAVEFTSFEINFEDLETRLGQVVRTRSDPPVVGYKFHIIKKENGKVILVLEISKSSNAPHAHVDPGKKYPVFYGRTVEGSKDPYTTSQIVGAIAMRETATEKMNDFHLERLELIRTNYGFLPLGSNPKIILHLSPISAFNSRQEFQINHLYNKFTNLFPICSQHTNMARRRNQHGLLVHNSAPKHGHYHGYTQLYRSGIIESADSLMLEPRQRYAEQTPQLFIPSQAYEKDLIEASTRFLKVLQDLGINSPIYCRIALADVKGYRMGIDFRQHLPNEPIDSDTLTLPETELLIHDEINHSMVAKALKGTFDIIWNACGLEKSLNYDENDNLIATS